MLWVKHRSVYLCVCVCQGSALTTVLSVSLCSSPTPLASSQRRENKGTSHCLIYLYPTVLPISTGAFISLCPTLKTIILQSCKVKRPLSVSPLLLSPSLCCLSWTHRGLLLPFSILLVFPDGSVKTDRKRGRQNGTTWCIVKVMKRPIKV